MTVEAAAQVDTGGIDLLDEIEALLRSVARGAAVNRAEASAYSRVRSGLLDSPLKDMLPGFLFQCLTILKFREFITLYDPDIAFRDRFVARAFDRCRSAVHRDAAPETPAQERLWKM